MTQENAKQVGATLRRPTRALIHQRDVRKNQEVHSFAGDTSWKQVRCNKVYQRSLKVASTRRNGHKKGIIVTNQCLDN